jgi:DNA-binding HxlR family transcriptional regulator
MVPNEPGEAGSSESVFELSSRSRRALELIADKWAVLILYALSRVTHAP